MDLATICSWACNSEFLDAEKVYTTVIDKRFTSVVACRRKRKDEAAEARKRPANMPTRRLRSAKGFRRLRPTVLKAHQLLSLCACVHIRDHARTRAREGHGHTFVAQLVQERRERKLASREKKKIPVRRK